MPPLLSKSRFQSGRQCLRRLWLECYRPDLAAPYDAVTEAVFAAGHEVGRLARQRFPGGVMVEAPYYSHEEAAVQTAKLLGDGVPAIFEAGFTAEGVRVRTDVLAQGENGGWHLIEVKSATGPKPEYLYDAAIQYHVLLASGTPLESVRLMHLNRDYVYDGVQHDPENLLLSLDVSREAIALGPEIEMLLAEQQKLVRQKNEPSVLPGLQCRAPYDCPFFEYCAPDLPAYWIGYLPAIKVDQFTALSALGVEEIGDIPDDFRLTPKQQLAREAICAGTPRVLADPQPYLAQLSFPLQMLDFETIAPALPRYARTRPYQNVPFQWSLHTVDKGGDVSHQEFLFDEDTDPRRAVAESLLAAVHRQGTVLAYHASFEVRVLRGLAEALPDLAPGLELLAGRIADLLPMVRSCYYHPDLLGSYSLKRVVPALVPDCVYDGLEVQEGGMASLTYLQMIAETDATKRARLRQNLLDYCQRDTWAMVRIWEELGRLAH
jgi:hypothetical protein